MNLLQNINIYFRIFYFRILPYWPLKYTMSAFWQHDSVTFSAKSGIVKIKYLQYFTGDQGGFDQPARAETFVLLL